MKPESYQKIKEFCCRNGLIVQGERILTALSGGADSVYLSLVLLEMSEEYNLEVAFLHVNHQIRGEEALRDEQFCRDFADRHGAKLYVSRVDIPQLVCLEKRSLEETARKYRYQYIEEIVRKEGYQKVAVAHHLNDQAETVLFQMLRGSSVRGMGGMRPGNGIYIRPLLEMRHEEIISELKKCGQTWCEDSTNQEEDCSRNRIRRRVLPMLEEMVNKGAVLHLARMAGQMQEIQNFLEEVLSEKMPLILDKTSEDGEIRARISEIKKLPQALKMEFAYRIIAQAAGRQKDITSRHMEALIELTEGESGRRIDLPYGLQAGRDYDILWIHPVTKFPDPVDDAERFQWSRDLAEPAEAALSGENGEIMKFSMKRENYFKAFEDNERKIPKNNCTKWFDYARINGMLEFRHPEKGDYLWLDVGQKQKKLLSRLLIDSHIPREQRKRLWVLAEKDHILWIPKLNRGSAFYYVSDRTEEILCINMITESEKKDERNSTCDVSTGAGGKQD